MQDEQKIIVEWMRRVMADRNWNPETWAEKAGISPTSITRAMKQTYQFVSKRQTIQKLAEAANVEPPALSGLTSPTQVNASNLEPILDALLPLAPRGRLTDQSLRALAVTLAYGLELLGDHLSRPASPDVLRTVVRGVNARFRELN